MPPCAPTSTYQRNNNKHSSGTRRVIFPTLYEDAASPEMMEAVTVPLDSKLEIPTLAPASLTLLTNHHLPHPCPPPPNLDIPEGPTPPRPSCTRRSILLGRFQPLPINQQFPVPKKPTQLVSILRATSFGGTATNTTCPKKDSSTQSLMDSIRTCPPKPIRRSSSEPGRSKNHIQFDPRIWIREFERAPEEQDCTWYNEDDLERFKRHAMALVMACKERLAPQIIPTGTGRTMTTRRGGKSSAFYTHSALAMEMEDNSLTLAMHNEQYRAMVAQQEIQRILIVDPHDICITLFSKAFRTLLPHVQIVTASSASDALEQIALHASASFDILVVEERLQTPLKQQHQQSGSDLFKTLLQLQQHNMTLPHSASLWIGVSAHPKDRSTLEESGADLSWGKPPPKMSVDLRNQLLQALLMKRGKKEFSRELFG